MKTRQIISNLMFSIGLLFVTFVVIRLGTTSPFTFNFWCLLVGWIALSIAGYTKRD